MAQASSPQQIRIDKIHKDYQFVYGIFTGIVLVLVAIWTGLILFKDTEGYLTNVFTDLISVIATIVIIDRINQYRADQQLKNRLLNELRSPIAATAVTALDWLRRENWLEDDSLIGKDLRRANWEGAFIGELNLEGANLQFVNFKRVTNQENFLGQAVNLKGTDFSDANLQDAILDSANLENAKLMFANLENANLELSNLTGATLSAANFHNARLMSATLKNADLFGAKLQDADLSSANLSGANLLRANLQNVDFEYAYLGDANLVAANLQGAGFSSASLYYANLMNADLQGAGFVYSDLEGANLRGANIENTVFGNYDGRDGATLPDGTKWKPDEDMERFTNPKHPEFEATLEKINAIREEYGREPIS